MQEFLSELNKNEVFRVYAFWSGVLVLKMLFMSVFTGLTRFRTQTFANPEDLISKKQKVKFNDEDVERVRRAHRNDLENILPFFVVGFFYILTSPSVYLATQLIRAVAISRILHTVVYAIVVLPQPARVIAFAVPLTITAYMGTFANPEDLISKKQKVKFGDEDVERVRRAHRNDLENILPFFVVGFFYILTSPSAYLATQLIRAVAISRILHTVVYAIVVIPQPARAIAFAVPLAITAYMGVQTVLFYL